MARLSGAGSLLVFGAPAAAQPEASPPASPPAPPAEEAIVRHRKLVLGVDEGVVWRPAKDAVGVTYAAGLAWGVSGRIEPAPWLGVRLLTRYTRQRVTLETGALGTDETLRGVDLDHPPLDSWLLGARVEPTWVVAPGLRLWAGVGAGWTTLQTDAPIGSLPRAVCAQNCAVRTGRRTGTLVEIQGALGLGYDLIRERLLAGFTLTGATFTDQSGTLFTEKHHGNRDDELQAFAAGRMYRLAPLPPFSGELGALVTLGLVL